VDIVVNGKQNKLSVTDRMRGLRDDEFLAWGVPAGILWQVARCRCCRGYREFCVHVLWGWWKELLVSFSWICFIFAV